MLWKSERSNALSSAYVLLGAWACRYRFILAVLVVMCGDDSGGLWFGMRGGGWKVEMGVVAVIGCDGNERVRG